MPDPVCRRHNSGGEIMGDLIHGTQECILRIHPMASSCYGGVFKSVGIRRGKRLFPQRPPPKAQNIPASPVAGAKHSQSDSNG